MIIIIFSIIVLGTYGLITWMSDENTELAFRIGKISGIYCSGESDVTLSNLGPVLNYEQDGDITTFTVQNESGNSIGVNAVLYIDSISDSLKRSDFKYAVQYSSDNSNFQTVSTGNFSNANANSKINILQGQTTGANGYFRIIFYIDGNMQNPTTMQNSSFSGSVKLCTTSALNVEETSLALSYPNAKNLTYVYDGDGTINCSVANESIASCSVDNATKVVTVTPVGVGTTTMTINEIGSSNLIPDQTQVTINVDYQSYTISYNANGGSGQPASQTKNHNVNLTLSNTIPKRAGYLFLGWSTSSSATSATYGAGASYTANESANLYAVWKAIPVGAYISYTAGGYSSWRVMYNNNGQLDIISTGSVADKSLGNESGYKNAVGQLNSWAKEYVNSTYYATTARCLGYSTATEEYVSKTFDYNSTGYPFEETNYTTDVNQLINNGLVQTDKEVWLASRKIEGYTDNIFTGDFGTQGRVRTLLTSGEVSSAWLHESASNHSYDDNRTRTYGLRPVVSLSSGLYVVSGDGKSQATAYVLSK